jgi:hypothetical protein
VVYGTSISQGGCAARHGLAYTNLLSRAMNAELINLGFYRMARNLEPVIRTIVGV